MSTHESNAAPALDVLHVRKAFGSRSVLLDASVRAAQGAILFLVGPSGCGKSTLLRIVAGLERADSGAVLLHGSDISDRPVAQRGIGLVFQNYALWPHLTVKKHLDFALAQQPVSADQRSVRRIEILELLGLSAHVDALPAQLSGGQQQRLALARSLCTHPALLLLDEPFSNLDLKLRRQVIKSLREIQQRFGMTLVIVAHDIEAVIQPQDLIAVMEAGRIAQSGTYAAVLADPVSPFVRDIVSPHEAL